MTNARILMIAVGALILGIAGTVGFFYLQHHNPTAVPLLSQEQPARHEAGEGRDFLSPEQQLMWRREHRSEMQGMTKDQKKAFRKQFRQQWQAMSEADRTKLRDTLQAQWNALPNAMREKLESRILQHRNGGEKNNTQTGTTIQTNPDPNSKNSDSDDE